jgi:26S proteasome regulatory subunit N13
VALTGREEDDMIIFPGEATFSYVEQARNNKTNNRVYALKFASHKKVHFFWMQEPNADKDKELAEKVNAMINGESPSASGPGQIDQAQLMAMLTQARSPSVIASAQPEVESPLAPAAGESGAPAASDSTAGASGEAGAGGSDEAQSSASDGDSKMKVDEEPKA